VTKKNELKIINANSSVPERKRAARKIDVCKIPISAAVIQQTKLQILIQNFRRVLYVVCFLLGNSSPSEFYMPTFRNTVPSS